MVLYITALTVGAFFNSYAHTVTIMRPQLSKNNYSMLKYHTKPVRTSKRHYARYSICLPGLVYFRTDDIQNILKDSMLIYLNESQFKVIAHPLLIDSLMVKSEKV